MKTATNGSRPALPPKDEEAPPLEIARFNLSQLAGMLPVAMHGRFHELKTHVKQEISRTGKGKYFIIKPTKKVLESAKERGAFVNAITGMFKKQNLPWVAKWSDVAGVFIVIRRDDWNDAKKRKLAAI